MKTVSDDLFQLIKTLSKQEKRYFKVYASRHVIGGKNKYVMLFDAIDKQKVYEEAKIKKKFSGEAFCRQLHVVKNYLYQLILSSLRSFTENKSEEKFYLHLRNAQLLFDKNLYKQGEKVLNKARKEAAEKENFLQLLAVSRWEHQIAHVRNDFGKLEDYLEDGIQSEFELLARYRNFLEFQALNDRVFLPYWKRGAIRTEVEKENLRKIFTLPLFQSAENAQSFNARYFYLNARFSYHFLVGELQESYEHICRMVEMFEKPEFGELKGRLLRRYISAITNLFNVQKQLGKQQEVLQTLQKLRKIPVQSPDQKRRLFIRSINLETDFYLSIGQFKKGITNLRPLEEEFVQYREDINGAQRLGLYYNLGYLYFGAGKYENALDWLNLLLNDPDLKTREDIHCFGRILNLITHYELGNDKLLEYITQSTFRFLSKRKRLFKVESVMLQFLKKYPGWISRQQQREGFQDMLNELFDLKKEEYERQAFEYFDFISWLESKLEGADFEEVVQKKRRRV